MGIIRRITNLSTRRAGIAIVAMLLFSLGIGSVGDSASAADHTNTTGETASLSVSGDVSLDLVPTSTGTVGIGNTNVLVTTDSTHGYHLLMSGSTGEDGYSPLYGPALSGDATLNRISSITSDNALAGNTWGYTLPIADSTNQTKSQLDSYIGNQYAHGELDTLIFSPVQTSPTTITTINSPTPTTGDTTAVYVGVKVGGTNDVLVTGNYNNSLVFTTIVEPNYRDTGALTITATNSSGTTNTVSSTTTGVGGDNTNGSTVNGDIGQLITLTTDYTNATTAVSSSNVHVYLFTGSSWNGSTTANPTNPTTPVAECTSITIDSTNNGTSTSKPLKLTCSVPTSYASTLTNNGTYGVAVEVLDTTNTGTNAGHYYFSYWMPNVYTITTKYNYTINYNANNGTNAPTATTGTGYIGSSNTITLSSSTPTRTYYNFLGWSESSSATSASYTAGGNYPLGTPTTSTTITKTLYAVWERQTFSYTIKYCDNTSTNCTSGLITDTTGTGNVGEAKSVSLSSTVPTKDGYTFSGWATTSGSSTVSYSAGSSYSLGTPTSTSSITEYLYAVWTENIWTATVNYDANNGSGAPAATTVTGISGSTTSQSVTLSNTTPTRTGYTFLGWSTSSTATTASYSAGSSIIIYKSSPTKTLYAVWGWTATVNYNASSGSGAPTATTATLSGSSGDVTLSTTEPTRSGYTFIGWASATSVPHTTYGTTVTVSETSPTITVYAEWIANTDNLTDGGDMQDASCSSLTHGTLYSMTDTRTSESYLVAKLADGNCWMLQNLYIPNGTTLTRSTSDVSSNYSLPSSSPIWGSNTTAYYYAGAHLDATQDSNVYGGDKTNAGSYFSFIAATAGKGTGSSVTVNYSVCPKGWRLPTGGYSSEFQALYTAYSSNTSNFNTAFKYNATSNCSKNGCPHSNDTNGHYWSSRAYNNTTAYCLYTNASSTYPSSMVSKSSGYSVRCVLAS